jgi:hypothetical protein
VDGITHFCDQNTNNLTSMMASNAASHRKKCRICFDSNFQIGNQVMNVNPESTDSGTKRIADEGEKVKIKQPEIVSMNEIERA